MSKLIRNTTCAVSMLAIGTVALAMEPPALPSAPSATPGLPLARPAPQIPPVPGQVGAALSPTNYSGPRMKFDSAVYDFGKVVASEDVKHTFYFTNTGAQDLIVTNAQGICGCTVVGDWTHRAKPGESGAIPFVFRTGNYNVPVVKFLTVTCNDRTQPGGVFMLQLKGTVWKPINMFPPSVALMVRPDSPFASASSRITNGLEQLMILSPPECSNTNFGAALQTNVLGRYYTVVVSNSTALPPGSAQGIVTLKTSLTNHPVLSLTVWANSQPPINVVPLGIPLRQGPLVTNQQAFVTIINNCTNPITLSEPAVDAKGVDKIVDITVTESQPGKYFTVLLRFPTGFELAAGQAAAFTVKTSNPSFPLVKVPILQPPRQPAPAVVLKRPAPLTPSPAAIMPQPPRPAMFTATPNPRGSPPARFGGRPTPDNTDSGDSTNALPPPPPPLPPPPPPTVNSP